MNSILVVGGAGYIGSRLIARLKQAGHNVGLWDADFYGTVDAVAKANDLQDVLKEDVRWIYEHEREACAFLKNFDLIIYLASPHDINLPADHRAVRRYYPAIMGECADLIRYMSGLPLVYVSSMRALTHPSSTYGYYKKAAEQFFNKLRTGAIVRFGTVWGGLSPHRHFPNRVVTVPNKYVLTGQLPDEHWRAYTTHIDLAVGTLAGMARSEHLATIENVCDNPLHASINIDLPQLIKRDLLEDQIVEALMANAPDPLLNLPRNLQWMTCSDGQALPPDPLQSS
jgi:nucleoside-diphosphate-sugar epimerase